MVDNWKPVLGQEGTVQSLARKALALLKLVEQQLTMQDPNLTPQAAQATETVEELVSSLEDIQKLAITNYEEELIKLEEDVQNTDWSKYQNPSY
ncbi:MULTISPECIES: hypothetical protein [Cyanophyceae]|uniref:hypothetical protein n=1 Tax=Cyanophyceae TaxID=3028117 RepID=UPI001688CC3B|nr:MULTISPECIES: hypothetical protein [Cyanophyceae]MBD1916246.1 hypothetical protein [Phormidium sp. FACHB-77]MBD2031485.1 hypothetical protein [Phormidium sp. FACHB-322]MBD2052888.1 hypothetical protein [Leptolyngbya sp. FACHB-60]